MYGRHARRLHSAYTYSCACHDPARDASIERTCAGAPGTRYATHASSSESQSDARVCRVCRPRVLSDGDRRFVRSCYVLRRARATAGPRTFTLTFTFSDFLDGGTRTYTHDAVTQSRRSPVQKENTRTGAARGSRSNRNTHTVSDSVDKCVLCAQDARPRRRRPTSSLVKSQRRSSVWGLRCAPRPAAKSARHSARVMLWCTLLLQPPPLPVTPPSGTRPCTRRHIIRLVHSSHSARMSCVWLLRPHGGSLARTATDAGAHAPPPLPPPKIPRDWEPAHHYTLAHIVRCGKERDTMQHAPISTTLTHGPRARPAARPPAPLPSPGMAPPLSHRPSSRDPTGASGRRCVRCPMPR